MGCIILLLLIIALPTLLALFIGGSVILWYQDHWQAIGFWSGIYVVLYYGTRFLVKNASRPKKRTLGRTRAPYNRHCDYKSWTAKDWAEWKRTLKSKPPRPEDQSQWTPEQTRDWQIESWLSLIENATKKNR